MWFEALLKHSTDMFEHLGISESISLRIYMRSFTAEFRKPYREDYVYSKRNHISLCLCILTVRSLDIITNLFDFEGSRAYNQDTFSPWTHHSRTYIFLKTHFFSRRRLILINVTSLRSNHKRVARLNFIGQ